MGNILCKLVASCFKYFSNFTDWHERLRAGRLHHSHAGRDAAEPELEGAHVRVDGQPVLHTKGLLSDLSALEGEKEFS